MNPYKKITASITPKEFELLCVKLLEEAMKNDNCEITHNVTIEKPDGDYQIDIVMERQDQFGLKYKTLVECKREKSPIERTVAQILFDKLRACGAHKGVIMSASGFQSRTIKYAKTHGIALIQIVETHILSIVNLNTEQKYKPRLVTNVKQPKYTPLMYDTETEFPLYKLSGAGIKVLADYFREVAP